MSLEYCSKCKKEFLTEADDYVVIPRKAYALSCPKCYFDKVEKQNKAMYEYMEHSGWITEKVESLSFCSDRNDACIKCYVHELELKETKK